MAPKSSKRGGTRKLALKKSTVRDLKVSGRKAKAAKGGLSYVLASNKLPSAPPIPSGSGASSVGSYKNSTNCIRSY